MTISDLTEASDVLRQLRIKTGLSQTQMAQACQLSRQRYNAFESDAPANITLRTFFKAVAACGYRVRLEVASKRPNLMQLTGQDVANE